MLDLDVLISSVRKTATPEVVAHVQKYGNVIKREYDAAVAGESLPPADPQVNVEPPTGIGTKTNPAAAAEQQAAEQQATEQQAETPSEEEAPAEEQTETPKPTRRKSAK